MAEKGNISIHAQNIMPVIKRWLYSDKDIFLRELVSNGCDAIAKHKLLSRSGDAQAEDAYRVDVIVDAAAGTLEIRDNGIGMSADEVRRYIAQVAFSGAEEFLQKYRPEEGDKGGIIGHFGLGFYSAFMVSDRVTIDTKSYREDEPAVRWTSEDGMAYEMEDSDRAERGTTIRLNISAEDHDYLNLWTVRATLEKYCAFMPVPIYLSERKAQTEEQDAEKSPKEPEKINDTSPLWLKRPADVTDEEYRAFYHQVFHEYDEPLFWIHLNAEYPFNLKGILYFPRIRNEFTSGEGVIKLYNNQVFVADNIKEVIPEFLMLLKGAIDCPDLPLNVSRSFLQNDGYVQKMSAYITRKVADRLVSEFTEKREDYQKYWDDIHPFVKYGCIRDAKFYERVKGAILFKTVDGTYMTLDEYREKNCPVAADADEEKPEQLLIYASDPRRQAQMIDLYRAQNRDVVLMDTMIDNNFMSFLEYGAGSDLHLRFRRVDAAMDGLTEDGQDDEDVRAKLEEKFRKALGQEDLSVSLKTFKSEELPAMVTVDEESRRMSEMSKIWGRGGFDMPQKHMLTLNACNPLIRRLAEGTDGELDDLICQQVMDLSEMARSPLESERMVAFLKRSNQLLTMLAEKS